MKTSHRIALFLLLIVAHATILAPGGSARVIYVPDEYPTIQIAINSSWTVNGDTIIVRPGTYRENLFFMGKAITLQSEHGPETTAIDGGDIYRTVTCMHGEGRDSVLDGFTITNGVGGIFLENAGATIINNVIHDNSSSGIYWVRRGQWSAPWIENNVIRSNEAPVSRYGGGISCYDDGSGEQVVIRGNTIICNRAPSGGGIAYDVRGGPSLPEIVGNCISSNHASDVNSAGGGIYLGDECAGKVSGNWIVENRSDRWGGGIAVSEANPTIEGNVIAGNSAEAGGGIHVACNFLNPIAPRIVGNEIRDNRVVDNGIEGGEGAGIWCMGKGAQTILANVIRGNRADERGGGICFLQASEGRVEGNLIVDNDAPEGAGLVVDHANPILFCNTIAGNEASFRAGGISIETQSTCSITNCIVWGNRAPAAPDVFTDGTCSITVAFCDIGVAVPGQGNISADPLFADPGCGDYHLTYQSPCRDAGSSAGINLLEDFEGDSRSYGGTIDIGADEFATHLYLLGSVIPGGKAVVKIVGKPAQQPVLLNLGYSLLDPPWPTQHGDLCIEMPPAATVNLGAVPADGILFFPVVFPPGWTTGDSFPFQALVGPWGGAETRLSNLMNLEVK